MIDFALASGLIKRVENIDDRGEAEQSLGIISHAGVPGEAGYLPGVEREVLALTDKLPTQLLHTPEPYPSTAYLLERLHFAGHGYVDPTRTHSTALLVGKAHSLEQGRCWQAKRAFGTCF